ncbi:NfeD family protein [Thorsellia kenyensis]|uniref:NfeD family protein n=1 Tax=Thorsellia kenyensis TaxID=1549888 RepID=A0ABV6CCB5_9GAMM
MDWITVIGLDNYYYLWLAMGLIFLLLEMLGTSGFFLWTGLASILMGIVIFLLPVDLSFSTQWIIYSVVLVINTYLWWLGYKKRRANEQYSSLNERSHQLINKRGILTEDIHIGLGRAQFGDSSWRVSSDENLVAGEEVIVVAVEGITLVVKKWGSLV